MIRKAFGDSGLWNGLRLQTGTIADRRVRRGLFGGPCISVLPS